MSLTKNLGRCARCNKYMIEEESRTHTCDFSDIEDAKEIILDHVRLGWGLDAILYRFVECKHNPPHRTKPKFTACGKRPPDKATLYPPGGVPH